MNTLKELYDFGEEIIQALMSVYEILFERTLSDLIEVYVNILILPEWMKPIIEKIITFLSNDVLGIGSMTLFSFMFASGIGIWIALTIVKWVIGIVT